MNGADVLIAALAELGLTHIFTNPGTTELELVRAMEAHERISPVLVTQELVGTAAADGFARMQGLGAVVLHLGPGFSNGAAFVHDARRARTPMLVIVGEHPRTHLDYDAPLNTDIGAIMAPFCIAVVRVDDPSSIATTVSEAAEVAIAQGGPVGMIVFQDVMASRVMTSVHGNAAAPPRPRRMEMTQESLAGQEAKGSELSSAILGRDPLILLGAGALTGRSQRIAVAIGRQLGARVLAEVFPSRMERGGGLPPLARLPYFPHAVRSVIGSPTAVVLVDTEEPLAYFAEEGSSAQLIPAETPRFRLPIVGRDAETALTAWAHLLGIGDGGEDGSIHSPSSLTSVGTGAEARIAEDEAFFGPLALGEVLSRYIHEGDIVVDEGRTSSAGLFARSASAPRHWYFAHPGGAIGGGLSLALGAAIASRARVLALVADGGALYAPQALWTIAQQGLRVGVVIVVNGGYQILRQEMQSRAILPVSDRLTRIENPRVDFVALAHAFGVRGYQASSAAELSHCLDDASSLQAPFVIVADIEGAR